MTNKDLLNLKLGDKIRDKKSGCILEFEKISNMWEGLLTSKEKEKIKPTKVASCKTIKGIDYSNFGQSIHLNGKVIIGDIFDFKAREIEKVD